jgi:hypothetical protein
MSELVAFFDRNPTELTNNIEIRQLPISEANEMRSTEGFIRTSLVYVLVPSEAGQFLVPFGAYDDWSLRDRYNEVIRIMNTLGASEIRCESFRERTKRRGLSGRLTLMVKGGSASIEHERLENSSFDFRHKGAGAKPRDPRPLRWNDEPGFSAAVTSVLENGATEVSINIRSNRTHSINGALGVGLKEIGFDLGGSTEHADVTTLQIYANFPEPKRGLW